ncbi:SspB family protein [Acidisoma cladoniae]|uniref:SspB family protein n=1 Tax=Acidisoma cladoniae TaxID=3040935 RepID=UPI00254E1F7D|nr:ClpXP protease specificity-enhancing factor SspB [Acidisoma sp. PAMC 29798]
MTDETSEPPESLIPYDSWLEEAQRQVVKRAIDFAGSNGLPGDHHFYITFRTNYSGVHVPARLSAQYPEEMTIVLQHQFWDLKIEDDILTVGLSFSGIPSTLVIPMGAIVGFADPHVRFGLRMQVLDSAEEEPVVEEVADAVEPAPEGEAPDPTPQVVSLDAFRRRAPPKD